MNIWNDNQAFGIFHSLFWKQRRGWRVDPALKPGCDSGYQKQHWMLQNLQRKERSIDTSPTSFVFFKCRTFTNHHLDRSAAKPLRLYDITEEFLEDWSLAFLTSIFKLRYILISETYAISLNMNYHRSVAYNFAETKCDSLTFATSGQELNSQRAACASDLWVIVI